MKRRLGLAVGAVLALGVAAGLALLAWDHGEDLRLGAGETVPAPAPDAVQRGAYLARVGHCGGCHTARGGAEMAGGRAIPTPFGRITAANLTPDADTGIGRWTGAAFRRALREGRSADGRALLPACPYPNFSLVTDADADDLHAYLRSLPPQHLAVPPPELQFPYGTRLALAAWRARHFRAAELPPGLPDDERRGAYLVGGLGHCSACHGRRDAWGATGGAFDLRGGVIPMQGWMAPSLADPRAAALSPWSEDEAVALLRTGRNSQATVSGPMAMVVAHSLQHTREDDIRAVARYLRRLPAPASAPASDREAPPPALLRLGERVYDDHCADCHGRAGEGVPDAGPALAGNRALALESPVNVVRMVLGGGFGPSTAAHPRPPGMPPYAALLGDEAIAAVVSHVRWRWGAQASPVDATQVDRQRGGDLR